MAKDSPARSGRNSAQIHAATNGGTATHIYGNPKRRNAVYALTVDAFFTAEKIVNFVDIPVIYPRGLGVSALTPEQFDREKKYQAALAVARAMLRQGIISDDDYTKTEAILRRKFCPFIGVFKPEIL